MGLRFFLKKSSLLPLDILDCPSFGSAFSYKNNHVVIIDHNSHQYKVNMNWGNLNQLEILINDCYEIFQNPKSRIIILIKHTKNNVIIYDKSVKILESWGRDFPSRHGLTLTKENGEGF